MRWPLSPLLSSKRARLSFYRGLAFLSGFLLLAGMTAPFHRSASGISAPPAIGANRQDQEKQGITVLEPGTPIKREMSGGETHLFQITLVAGQFLRAIFDQRGVNLLITLYGPDGKKIADLDSPIGSQGPEPVSLIADTSGSYRLEARPFQKSAPKGQYEVRIEELRTATPRDKLRVDAERVFAGATIIAGQGTAESKRQAIEKYRESIPLWQGLSDPQQEAHTLTVIGYQYKSLSEPRQALDYFERALPLNRAANDRPGEAMTLYQLGSVYNIIGDHQKALEFYQRALPIFRAVGDRSMEAATLGKTGVVRSDLGEY